MPAGPILGDAPLAFHPIVAALWISSWISGLDFATGDRAETYIMWGVTTIASALLLRRLVRAA